MIKIRLNCLPEIVQPATKKLMEVFDITSISKTHRDRAPAETVRVYLYGELPGQLTDKRQRANTMSDAWEKSKKEKLI